jgi:hypothetical protein
MECSVVDERKQVVQTGCRQKLVVEGSVQTACNEKIKPTDSLIAQKTAGQNLASRCHPDACYVLRLYPGQRFL